MPRKGLSIVSDGIYTYWPPLMIDTAVTASLFLKHLGAAFENLIISMVGGSKPAGLFLISREYVEKTIIFVIGWISAQGSNFRISGKENIRYCAFMQKA